MKKSFGLWSAIFLGIGSMVGAGIFVLLGETGAIAGNLVWVSFVLGGIIALLSGYSMAKLASIYPSRGGIIEYLVQCYGTGIFSGTISVLFYISALVGLTMVVKTFGTYFSMMFGYGLGLWVNIFSVGIIITFVFINLLGSKLIAKSENIIVILKLSILVIFIFATAFFIKPELLKIDVNSPIFDVLSSIGLAFFAFEGFRVITNTAEDIENPEKNILKAMIISITLVLILYVAITIVVFGNLSLDQIIKAKDYALAEAAKPVFGQVGFTIISIAALISTASSINANLYAVTNVSYNMAKDGELPKQYAYNVYHSTQGLVISSIFIIIFILFFDLSEIASIGAISMLFIHLLVHIGHLFKIKETKASKILVYLAILTISGTIILAYNYMSKHIDNIGYLIVGSFIFAFILEICLRLLMGREIKGQTKKGLLNNLLKK